MNRTSEERTTIIDLLKASLPKINTESIYSDVTYLTDKKLTVKIRK